MGSENKQEGMLDYFKSHSIVMPKDFLAAGFTRHNLNQLINDGLVVKLGRGMYQLSEQDVSQWQSYLEVQRQAPKSTVCLPSALVFHGMTTQNPYEIWVAQDRNAWRLSIDYPPVRYFTMSGNALSEGFEIHKIDGVNLNVFSPAKTVADCFKYRNKIGLDIALEALKGGWHKKIHYG